MTIVTVVDVFRAVFLGLGALSIIFSLLTLRSFLQRHPPVQIRQHVGRVSLTYTMFVVFGIVDTVTHWGDPFRWQLFGYALVFIMAINAQAPLLSYERKGKQFSAMGFETGPSGARTPRPAWQATLTMTAILVIMAVVILGVGIRLVPSEFRSPAFDPLELSLQHVTSRVDGVTGPAVHLDDELKVDATKCNKSGMEIGISGRTRWVSVEPGGTVVEGITSSGTRPSTPCLDFHFSNKFPAEVVARTQELLDEGRTSVSWTYTGVETPLGLRGVSRAWSTEVFKIVR